MCRSLIGTLWHSETREFGPPRKTRVATIPRPTPVRTTAARHNEHPAWSETPRLRTKSRRWITEVTSHGFARFFARERDPLRLEFDELVAKLGNVVLESPVMALDDVLRKVGQPDPVLRQALVIAGTEQRRSESVRLAEASRRCSRFPSSSDLAQLISRLPPFRKRRPARFGCRMSASPVTSSSPRILGCRYRHCLTCSALFADVASADRPLVPRG